MQLVTRLPFTWVHPRVSFTTLEQVCKLLELRGCALGNDIRSTGRTGFSLGTVAHCNVSFTDSDGVSHTAHVQAESLYEAVAHAIAEFRGPYGA
jgi:hypothetical protein